MQERLRALIRRSGPDPSASALGAPSSSTEAETTLLTHGVYAQEASVSGMTVGEVRRRYRDELDLHPEAQPVLDGNPVDEDVTVRGGQTLSFIRPAGERGAAFGSR